MHIDSAGEKGLAFAAANSLDGGYLTAPGAGVIRKRCMHGLVPGTCSSCIDMGLAEKPSGYMPDMVAKRKMRKVKAVRNGRQIQKQPKPEPKPERSIKVPTLPSQVKVVPPEADGFNSAVLERQPKRLIEALSQIARCGACRGLVRCEPSCDVPQSRRQGIARDALNVAPNQRQRKKLLEMVSKLPETFVASDAQELWLASRAKSYAYLRELERVGLVVRSSGRGVRGAPVVWSRT